MQFSARALGRHGPRASAASTFLAGSRRGSIGLVLGSVALLIGAIAVVPAWGDAYGTFADSARGKPDNSEHTYCFASDYTGDNARNAAHAKMTGLDNQTTMFRNFVSGCTSNTDAKFNVAELGFDGRWICVDRSGNYCLSSRLEFDRSSISSNNDWLQTACHEIGHSVGLSHGDGSDCMGFSHDGGDDRSYDFHNVTHINNDRF